MNEFIDPFDPITETPIPPPTDYQAFLDSLTEDEYYDYLESIYTGDIDWEPKEGRF